MLRFVASLILASLMQAADVTGTIVVRHKLTKRRVTASSDSYARGTAVPLADTAAEDPLQYERTHVVIYIEDGEPSQGRVFTASLEQRNRSFVPDLVVIAAGGTVSFPNLDPVFHNVFSLSKVKSFDLGNYPKGHSRTVAFPHPGVVLVNCQLHPNMTAAILVTPNPMFTRSDSSGRFVLKDVPPGVHTVVAWHKAAGFFRQQLTVDARSGGTVTFDLPLDEAGAPIVAKSRLK